MREGLRWVCGNPVSWFGAHVLPPLTDDLNFIYLFIHPFIHSTKMGAHVP